MKILTFQFHTQNMNESFVPKKPSPDKSGLWRLREGPLTHRAITLLKMGRYLALCPSLLKFHLKLLELETLHRQKNGKILLINKLMMAYDDLDHNQTREKTFSN